MHIDLQKVQPVVYDSITVKEITEPSDLETWIDIIVKSYGTNAAEFTKFIQYISDNAAPTALHFYTAYYQDIPAAASMVIRSGTTIALHWVGTLPEYRGKGLGYAVSHTPLIDAKHNHATHAVLFASTMGKPIYERLGFRKYALYDVYGL
jgi:predicted GNAT family acetyltransferase